MTNLTTVILRPEDWAWAYQIGKLVHKPSDLGKLLGIEGDANKLVECVDCDMCQAPPGSHCRTLTGGTVTRHPHKVRILLLMAVMEAVSKEITIYEEEQIEDIL